MLELLKASLDLRLTLTIRPRHGQVAHRDLLRHLVEFVRGQLRDWMKDSMRLAAVTFQSGAAAVAFVEFDVALFAEEDEPMPSRLRTA
ncbi:hypothetical protein HV824_12070 [Myxococcus sp. AM009]|uniref:hypothetical protein n=1 Tax=Myxococcus sp. AM009 TaxID=2745137 RepID=UPI0015956307|nr:hypothetical protein [Myxococcus sp. AM009]NVI98851.1 hypothetical protein [Myxococcus sp. AM009]